MDSIRHDLRTAVRSLANSPGFTAIATTCIALGIATNVFVWAPINAILVRPLPYRDSEQVMQLSTYQTTGERQAYGSWSYGDYDEVSRELHDVFSAIGAYTTGSFNVGGGGEPERLDGARVSASLFPLLGVEPSMGRFFRPDEEGDSRTVVIGYGVWERKFGRDPKIIGTAISVDGVPHEVIGVMARGMRIPEREDVWLPLNPGDARVHREWRFYQLAGRLGPGITQARADARLAAFMRVLEERHGDTNRQTSAWLIPMNELVAREVRPIFLIMLGAVGFVLLIACANVANLLLARGSGRQREVAVRLAMGASRTRIVRQLLTESLLLAIVGGGAGLLVGTWTVDLFTTRMMPTTVPYWMTFDIDRTIVLVTIGTTLLTGAIFGVAPALHLSRPSLTESLKAGGSRGASAGTGAGRTRRMLVVGELALSLVLLVGAGLMVRSFMQTMNATLGFNADRLLTFQLHLTGERYASDSSRAAFVRTLEERLASLPGVTAVGATTQLPIATCCRTNPYFPDGKAYPPAGGPFAHFSAATPSFTGAMQIPLLAGRPLEATDLTGDGYVVIVDSLLAAREWPGESALGKQLRFGGENAPLHTVVGVMSHLVGRQVTERAMPEVILPLRPDSPRARWYALRTAVAPEAVMPEVRKTVRALDADLPLAELASMDFVVRNRMFQPRVYGSMFALFAVAALVLATIGLYGVMSYLVAQRTREIGVRMALGANRAAVLRMVMGNAGRLVAGGLLIGFPAAVGLAQLLRGLLYGVSATDPVTLVGISALLATVALAASWIPARRATHVDPMTALRSE